MDYTINFQAHMVLNTAAIAIQKIPDLSNKFVIVIDSGGRWWDLVADAINNWEIKPPEHIYLNFGVDGKTYKPEWSISWNKIPIPKETIIWNFVIQNHFKELFSEKAENKNGIIIFDDDFYTGKTANILKKYLIKALKKPVYLLAINKANRNLRKDIYLTGCTIDPFASILGGDGEWNKLKGVIHPIYDKNIEVIDSNGFTLKKKESVVDPELEKSYREWQSKVRTTTREKIYEMKKRNERPKIIHKIFWGY